LPAVVPYGQSRAVNFVFKNLKPGLHQVEFSLEAADKLMFDNTRFLTFKVGETRRVLTIAEDPAAAGFWQEAVRSKSEFDCLVVKPTDVKIDNGNVIVSYRDPEKPDGEPLKENIRAFDVVVLFSIPDPSQKNNGSSLWDKVRPYVESGGKLVIIPGDDRLSIDGYKAGGNLMPGEFKGVIETDRVQPPPPQQTAPGWSDPRDGKNGVTWFLDEKVVQHPMLRPFQGWSATRDDVIKLPRRALRYWDVKKADEALTIVSYNDAEKAADRRPAVLERAVPDPKEPTKMRGRVLLLTTRMDTPLLNEKKKWNDYWDFENSWCVVFPTLVIRYLAGDVADANFNFETGQVLTVPLPKGGVPRGTKVVIDGPGIVLSEALIEVGDKQTELRLSPPRTDQPGNFQLVVEALKWRDGFSLNVPADESKLDKVPVEAIEELTGKESVFPLAKDKKLADIVKVIADQPIDLYPWLLIAVLMLLALEGLVANRFYRKIK
jgi:hypothetical protein